MLLETIVEQNFEFWDVQKVYEVNKVTSGWCTSSKQSDFKTQLNEPNISFKKKNAQHELILIE